MKFWYKLEYIYKIRLFYTNYQAIEPRLFEKGSRLYHRVCVRFKLQFEDLLDILSSPSCQLPPRGNFVMDSFRTPKMTSTDSLALCTNIVVLPLRPH